MFLAPPVLDLICIRTLDLRLLCCCSHFGFNWQGDAHALSIAAGVQWCRRMFCAEIGCGCNGAAQQKKEGWWYQPTIAS